MTCPLYYTKQPDYSDFYEIYIPCTSIIKVGKKPKIIEHGISNFREESFQINYKRPDEPGVPGKIETRCVHGWQVEITPAPSKVWFINRCGLHDYRRIDPSVPVQEIGNCQDNFGDNTSEIFGGTDENPCLITLNIEFYLRAFDSGETIFEDTGDFFDYYFDTSGYIPPSNTLNCGDCELDCNITLAEILEIKSILQGI